MNKILNIILCICMAGIVFISVGQLLAGGDKVFIAPIIAVAFWGMTKLLLTNY